MKTQENSGLLEVFFGQTMFKHMGAIDVCEHLDTEEATVEIGERREEVFELFGTFLVASELNDVGTDFGRDCGEKIASDWDGAKSLKITD